MGTGRKSYSMHRRRYTKRHTKNISQPPTKPPRSVRWVRQKMAGFAVLSGWAHRKNLPCAALFLVILLMYAVLVIKFMEKHKVEGVKDLTSNRLDKFDPSEGETDPHGPLLSVQKDLDSLQRYSEQVLRDVESAKNLRTAGQTVVATDTDKDTTSSANDAKKKENTATTRFPSPIEFSGENALGGGESQAVLVVGGTDGSGTRRVVQVLAQLGVAMVSEDPETYDIHADIVSGWPAIVKPVLSSAHRVDYDPLSLSVSHPREHQGTVHKLKRLLDQVQQNSKKPTSFKLAVGGVLPKPVDVQAQRVKYGFKAPVAMTLLPYWAHLLDHCKFVHVLRDGRDIAFSVNQGPVQKFYQDMYGKGDTSPAPVKGIKLWSDWNTQIYQWSKRFAQSLSQQSDQNTPKSFGYLAVHTEDFVNESPSVRFAAIYHLAKFVGSTISNDAICCMAMQSVSFMGSHDRSQVDRRNQEKQVSSRYGKWRKHTENNPTLAKALFSAGADGLKSFGYDPLRLFSNADMATEDGYQCTSAPANCDLNVSSSQKKIDITKFAIQNVCEVREDVDYRGGENYSP